MEITLDCGGKKVIVRDISYGDFEEVVAMAEKEKQPLDFTAYCKGIVSWEFTDEVTGKLLPITPMNLRNLKPVGYTLKIIDAFKKLNDLSFEEQKK